MPFTLCNFSHNGMKYSHSKRCVERANAVEEAAAGARALDSDAPVVRDRHSVRLITAPSTHPFSPPVLPAVGRGPIMRTWPWPVQDHHQYQEISSHLFWFHYWHHRYSVSMKHQHLLRYHQHHHSLRQPLPSGAHLPRMPWPFDRSPELCPCPCSPV